MFVGVCRLTFHLHGVSSLKGKRQVVRRIVERTRAKFNASVAEVAENDVHKRAIVGISVIGNDKSHVDAMMSTVIRFVDRLGAAPIFGVETEVISLCDRGDDVPRSIEEWRGIPDGDDCFSDVDNGEDEEDLW